MLRRWPVERRWNGHVTEVVSLMGREWSCYGGGQFNGGRMINLISGQFYGGRMVILQTCSL